MREYKINHYSKQNEWVIVRKHDNKIRYLSPEKIRTRNKEWAKRFYYEEDAVGVLISIRTKGELKNETEYIEEKINEGKEKRTRTEL